MCVPVLIRIYALQISIAINVNYKVSRSVKKSFYARVMPPTKIEIGCFLIF